jgi:hypothetical protein
MNFLTIKTSWANVEFIPFKLSIVSAGIFIGAYFHDFFRHYDRIFHHRGVDHVPLVAQNERKPSLVTSLPPISQFRFR